MSAPLPKHLVACHHCDLLQHEIELPKRAVASCVRCGAELYRNRHNSLDLSLALSIAAAQVFLLANTFPLVSMEVQGEIQSTTLPQAVVALYKHHSVPLAVLVFVTTMLAPAIEIASIVYLLTSLRIGVGRGHFALVFRFVQSIRRWGMIDVLMLGVLVSLVKLAALAEVVPGIALWAYCVLLVLMVAMAASFNTHDVWRWSAERSE
ncbi:MAG: Paraquat-inducible protein [Nevskia sp.]|nr:Paraquat-inducible protein [Nevskia sp.]